MERANLAKAAPPGIRFFRPESAPGSSKPLETMANKNENRFLTDRRQNGGMTVGAQAFAAAADSLEPPYRESPRCLLRLERDGTPRLFSASAALAALLQKQPEAIAGRPAAEVLGTDAATLGDAVRACLAADSVLEVDVAVTLPQGAIPSRLVLMPQPDRETTVQLLLIDLRPQSLRGTVGTDIGDDMLVRYRADLTVLDCSESYAQFHGRRPTEIIGRTFADWLPPAEFEIVRCAVAEAGTRSLINTNQIAKTQPDGSQRWYRWVDVALPVRPGEAAEFLSVGLNITAMKRARDELQRKNTALVAVAEELREAQIAAEDSNRAKSRFLAHMSHELRTPLNGIIGFADIMRAGLFGPIEPERYRDYVGLIHNSGELLLSLINDILDMSKIEAGKMELTIEKLETTALAEACRIMVIGMARDSSVVVKVEIAPDCTEVDADARAAKQMIINLLSNAVKFTPAGGIVTLGFRKHGDAGVSISVADNGIGMTPAELEKALQPFGQIDSELARQRKGTGIGLTLVKSLAELHGGTLEITSVKGVGTTATITLPWMKPAA
jgi:PAS domain S-box-containing protein